MFRAGLTLVRRVTFAASLLILLVCGAEVAVRTYEASTGDKVCSMADGVCGDTSKLSEPSRSFYQELKPMAVAHVECRDSNSIVEVRTNSLRLRGPELAIPKPQNLCRIVVLGDETIFAPETEDTDHFCTLLQQQLQQRSSTRIEVVNAGVPGHCPLTEYLLFKQRLLLLKPDVVLLHFDWSDVAEDQHIRRRARCDEAGIPQSCPHAKLDTAKKERSHDVWRQHFRLMDWAMNSLSVEWKQQLALQKAVSREVDTNPYAWLRDERPEKNLSFRHAAEPINHLFQLCQAENIQFVLMTSPKPWQVSAKCSRGQGVRLAAGVAQDACYLNRAPFDLLASYAEREQIPFADGSMVMTPGKDAESNFLRYAPRWSPTGHQRMADLVADCFLQQVPGPWNHGYFQQNEQPLSREYRRDDSVQPASGERSNINRFEPAHNRQLR